MNQYTKITSIPVNVDLTNWEAGLASNGGKYSFTEYLDVFMTIVDGTGHLRTVTRFGTSAEFSYDELLGGFQSDLKQITFIDTDEKYMSRYNAPLRIEEMSTPILFSDLLNLQNKILNTEGEIEMWPGVPAHKEQEILDKVLNMPEFKRWEMRYPELKQSWELMCKNFETQEILIPEYCYDIYNSELLKPITKESAFLLLSKGKEIETTHDLGSAFDWIGNSPENNPEFWGQIHKTLYC
jgi:hypothetical protein